MTLSQIKPRPAADDESPDAVGSASSLSHSPSRGGVLYHDDGTTWDGIYPEDRGSMLLCAVGFSGCGAVISTCLAWVGVAPGLTIPAAVILNVVLSLALFRVVVREVE